MKTIVLFLTASQAAQTVLSTTVDCAEPCRNGLRGTNMKMAECLAKNCGSLYREIPVSIADNFIYNDFNYGQCKQDKPLELCECKRACFIKKGVPRKQRECTDICDDIHTSTSSINEDEDTSTKDESVATAERSNEDTDSADELDADSYDEDESIDTEERTVTNDDSDSSDEVEEGAYDEDEDESRDTEEERSSTSDEDSGDATSTANTDQERDTFYEEDASNVDTETDNNNPADVKAGAYERYRRMRKVYV